MRRTIGFVCLLAGLSLALATGTVAAHPGIDEQIRTLTQTIEAHPEDAKLFLRRGELHRIHTDWELAEADYRAALRLDPGLLVAEFCLGRLKLETGHPAEAKTILDRYLSRRPDDPEARAARGRALVQLGQPLAAAEDFDRALEHPRNGTPRPEHYLERARALQAAGTDHLDAAIAGLDEGLARLGQPVTLQMFAIDLELERKNYDGALARLDRLAADSVRKEPWLMRKAAVFEAAGRREDARLAYRQTLDAIEALPSSRRGNKAVTRLEDEARSGLRRLDASSSTE